MIYAVIYSGLRITIPDGAGPDVECAYSWYLADDDYLWMEVLNLNTSDFWRGYFYWNDMEEADDACEEEFNTQEHLDAHWDSNNAGGHYDCTKYEHIVNGEVIETINHSNN